MMTGKKFPQNFKSLRMIAEEFLPSLMKKDKFQNMGYCMECLYTHAAQTKLPYQIVCHSNICMKTWIFTLSLELVHPLLLQALIWKKDPTVLIFLSLSPRRLVENWAFDNEEKYSKNWENGFSWLVHDEDINGTFCRVCKQTTAECATQHTGGVWVTKPLWNWRRATERIKCLKEVASTLKPVKPASHIKTWFSWAATELQWNLLYVPLTFLPSTILLTLPISPN